MPITRMKTKIKLNLPSSGLISVLLLKPPKNRVLNYFPSINPPYAIQIPIPIAKNADPI